MKELWISVKCICIINIIGWISSNNENDNSTQSPGYTYGIAHLATHDNIIIAVLIKLLIEKQIQLIEEYKIGKEKIRVLSCSTTEFLIFFFC